MYESAQNWFEYNTLQVSIKYWHRPTAHVDCTQSIVNFSQMIRKQWISQSPLFCAYRIRFPDHSQDFAFTCCDYVNAETGKSRTQSWVKSSTPNNNRLSAVRCWGNRRVVSWVLANRSLSCGFGMTLCSGWQAFSFLRGSSGEGCSGESELAFWGRMARFNRRKVWEDGTMSPF